MEEKQNRGTVKSVSAEETADVSGAWEQKLKRGARNMKIETQHFGEPDEKKTSKIVLTFEVSEEDRETIMNRTVEFVRKLRRHRKIGYCVESKGNGV